MTTYALSKEAHQDLKEVTWYTLNKWGREEAEKYITGLQNIFEGIGSGNVIKKLFNDWYPEILVAKYRYHFVFYLTEDVEKPYIIGIIHEKRDIINRLNERLN